MRRTHQWQCIFLWSEQVARFTLHAHATSRFIVFNRANEKLILAQQVREYYAKDDGSETAANESFPRLFRTQLDEWRATEEEPKQICHHIVAHDHRDRYNEPNQTCWRRQQKKWTMLTSRVDALCVTLLTFKYILNNQVALCDNNQ